MDAAELAPVRIGLWGIFDVEDLGSALASRVARAELARRIPEADVRTFAPLGYDHLTRFDGGEPAEPLGTYAPERLARLADRLDCVIVGPGDLFLRPGDLLAAAYGLSGDETTRRGFDRFFVEGLGPELERECPVLWHAVALPSDIAPQEAARFRDALAGRPYVSVGDEVSKRRLEAAGVEREIVVVADPAVLTPSLFEYDVLAKRLEYLRVTDRFPAEGPAVVVQGNGDLVSVVPGLAGAFRRLAAEREGMSVVVAETSPVRGDDEFAAALAAALPSPVYRLGTAGVEDLMAAVAGSAGFIGSSVPANLIALAYDRPHLVLALDDDLRARAMSRMLENPECLVTDPEDVPAAFEKVSSMGDRRDVARRLGNALAAHFDRLAEVGAAAAARRAEVRLAAAGGRAVDGAALRRRVGVLRRALEARGRLLVEQRWTFADRVQEAEARERHTRERLEEEIAILRSEIHRLEAEVEGKDRELRTLLGTRTFRYTAGLRRLWGRLRRR